MNQKNNYSSLSGYARMHGVHRATVSKWIRKYILWANGLVLWSPERRAIAIRSDTPPPIVSSVGRPKGKKNNAKSN